MALQLQVVYTHLCFKKHPTSWEGVRHAIRHFTIKMKIQTLSLRAQRTPNPASPLKLGFCCYRMNFRAHLPAVLPQTPRDKATPPPSVKLAMALALPRFPRQQFLPSFLNLALLLDKLRKN